MTMKYRICLAAAVALSATWARDFVTYEQFGAVGDGKADDQDAIIAAHMAANEKGLPVKAGDCKTYYIGKGFKTADIRTDVDFGTATIVIDDREVPIDKRSTPIFRIPPSSKSLAVKGVAMLAKGQANIGVQLPGPCLVEVVDNTVRQYIRYGLNQNNGIPKREVFLAAQHIPYGHTVTSQDIARQIGKPHAVRAVEAVCRTNPYYIVVPTHRVILSNESAPASKPLIPNEALRRLEKRHLDKVRKRG